MTNDLATIVSDLLRELATELDIHYENEDFFALGPTIEPMRRAAAALEASGHSVPDACVHVVARFLKTQN